MPGQSQIKKCLYRGVNVELEISRIIVSAKKESIEICCIASRPRSIVIVRHEVDPVANVGKFIYLIISIVMRVWSDSHCQQFVVANLTSDGLHQ